MLVILDEVQASFGRTGSIFAFHEPGFMPDRVVVGKGFASGVPMSAVIGTRGIFESLAPGLVGGTYTANPLSCAACEATIEVLLEEDLPSRTQKLGYRVLSRMRGWVGAIRGVGDARGSGMSFGLDLVKDVDTRIPDATGAREVLLETARQGLALIPSSGVHENVVRFAPPLSIDQEDLDRGMDILEAVLQSIPSSEGGRTPPVTLDSYMGVAGS